jgi:hypothetical protein
MALFLTPPLEPALRDFLDEVVVPILVERFLHKHRATHDGSATEGSDSITPDRGERATVSQNLPLRNANETASIPVIVGP